MQDQAYLIKGFLLGKDAPKPILAAIDAIIAELGKPREEISGGSVELAVLNVGDDISVLFTDKDAVITGVPPSSDTDQDEAPTRIRIEGPPDDEPKKRRGWSPEALARSEERKRIRQEAKQAKKRYSPPGES